MKRQRPLIGLALLLPFWNCASAQERVTFPNQLTSFTNLQGVAYRNVRLVRADLDGLIYREGVGGGRVCYTNLPAAFLESLGISSNQVAVAKARSDHRAVAAAYYRQRLQQQAQEEMAAKALLNQLRDLAASLDWKVVQGTRDGALIEHRVLSGRQSARPAGT